MPSVYHGLRTYCKEEFYMLEPSYHLSLDKKATELSEKAMGDLVRAMEKPLFCAVMAHMARANDRQMRVVYSFMSQLVGRKGAVV